MKAIINKSFGLVAGCVFACCFSLLTQDASAIEGLQIAVQSTDVILSWPSTDTETYIIQYRPTLTAESSWATLEDFYPAASDTNITYFVHSNSVQYPLVSQSSGSGGDITPSSFDSASKTSPTSEIMAVPANGSGSSVPLILYPSGFDLSGFTIFDSFTGESVSGSGYVVSPLLMESDGIQPMDAGSGDTNQYTGFYRVVRNGIHLVGITNDMVLSGVVQIPIELGNASGDVSTICITEGSTPIGDSTQMSPLSNPHALTFNTSLLSNGVHQINGFARWDDTNGGVWEADSPAISVTVSNEITFENWMPNYGELGNTLLFRATSAHSDTDWYVDVYDDTYFYIGTFAGHTYDGDISFYWDLVDPYGNTLTNSSFFIFKISTEYIDPPTPPTYKVNDPWTQPGGWVFASQHAFDSLIDHDMLYDQFSDLKSAAAQYWPVFPQSGSAFAIHFQDAAEQSDWTTFKQAVFANVSRNLCYFGHGGPSGIGYNSHDTNVFLSVKEIGARLHTIPAGQTNIHRFRFVFLDGCSTAKGTLPEAFGILHRENVDGIDYYNASLRRSAFCGWSSAKMVGNNLGNNVNYDHISFITLAQTYMGLGYGLKQSIDMSANQPHIPYINTSELRVFGYWDLHTGTDNN